MMTAQALERSVEMLAEQFRETGFVVARGLLDAAEVAQIRDVFMEAAKNGPVPGISETLHHVGGEFI